jgi:glycolate oxidase FAD binding subunit
MHPSSVAEIQDRLAAARAAQRPLEIMGGGTKRCYGRLARNSDPLSTLGLAGIVDYQPRELIAVVRAGTPLAELEAALAVEGQMLAFEPPHWGAGATVGGTVACNLSGPRRFKAGAARDHLLGFQAVSGRGEVFRAGGRVVKNVTGYDLSKLMCGSFGTLAVLTEVCLKVLPRAETERTVAAFGLSPDHALELMTAAAKTPHDVSGLAHLPEGSVRPAPLASAPAGAVTLMRVEGPAPSVAYRTGKLARLVAGATVETLPQDSSREVWRAIRELEPVPVIENEALWRLSIPPAQSRIAEVLARHHATRGFADWGGALLWAVLPAGADARAIHRAAADAGGHARLVRATGAADADIPMFPEQSPVRARLHASLKQAFDPAGILNPGRLHPEW